MSIEIVIQQKPEMSQKEITRNELIKKFNSIVREIENKKVRFNIHEYVNENR